MRAVLFLCLALWLSLPAHAETPTESSLQELLLVMGTESLLDNAIVRMESSLETTVLATFSDQKLTQDEQQVLKDMRSKMITVLKEEMSWQVWEPVFLSIYKNVLTQSEVDGMINFYKSDAGQALTAKMPLIIQNSAQVVQRRMALLTPRLQQLQGEGFSRIKQMRLAAPTKGTAAVTSEKETVPEAIVPEEKKAASLGRTETKSELTPEVASAEKVDVEKQVVDESQLPAAETEVNLNAKPQ